MARTLDPEFVDRVISMVNEGMTNTQIADCLGSKPANIQYIRSTNKNRVTFSRYKGGLVSRTIQLPPQKEEEDVYRTTEALLTAERTIVLGGMKTVLWYTLKSDGTIKVQSRDRSETLTLTEEMLHGFIEELMRLTAVIPKIKVTDMESW